MAVVDITAQRLRELLHYDPETGVFKWIGRTNNKSRVAIGSVAGNVGDGGYIGIWINRRRYPAHRLALLWVDGEMPSLTVDHINGERTDNRLANLRQVTRSTNAQNRHAMNSKSYSGLLGVHKAGHKWRASISVSRVTTVIGYFHSPQEAHEAYLAAKKEMHHGWELSEAFGHEASKDRTASA